MSSPLVRCVALLLLLLAHAPALAAGLLAVGGMGGEHEFQCRFGNTAVEITLHHRSEECSSAPVSHSHNWAERLLVGRSVSNDEPDHHFGYARQSVLVEEDGLRAQGEDLMDLAATLEVELPVIELPKPADLSPSAAPADPGGLSPPRLERRGVVMRL